MAVNSGQVRDYHAFPADELPEGWCRSTLGDLADLVSGAGFPIKYQGRTGLRYPFFKVGNLGDVNSGELLTETPDTIDNVIINELHAKVIPTNSIVFAKIGMAIRLNRRRMVGVPCCIDNNMMAAVSNGAALPHYLLRFLETVDFMALTQATTVPSIRKGDFESLSIPLPPIAEQKRIVAKVEELFEQVNAAKERLARVSVILKRFRQAVLAAACSGRLTADWREKHFGVEPTSDLLKRIQQDRKKPKKSYLNRTNEEEDIYFDIPDSWSFCFFEDICSNKPQAIKAGPFGSSLTKSCYAPFGYKIYGQEQVIRGDAYYGNYYIGEKKFLELKSCEVEARDLLISLVGTIGKVLIIPDNFEKGIINPRLVKISLHSKISPEYISNYLASPVAINMFKRDSHGGTMEILNLRMLKGLPIPLPPVIEQHEIVRRVEVMFKLAHAVEKRVEAATVRAQKLIQAILAKAFRGELVPTEAELARREHRSYESASDLLARIKSQRDAKQVSQKVRRNRN
jgi:type I restriction enzyme S subunit